MFGGIVDGRLGVVVVVVVNIYCHLGLTMYGVTLYVQTDLKGCGFV